MRKTHSIALLLALVLPAAAQLPAPTGASFAKGAKFTVAGYPAERPALTGFPVLVRIAENSPSGFSYADLASSTGDDLCFIDLDGTGIPFEIDTWDAQGTSLVWVTLPTMTNGAEFVMCWGGGTSGKTVCSESPFSGYIGVWHMSEASGTVADSSGNGLTASPAGANASVTSVAVDGRIGNARQCATNVADTAASYLSVQNYDSSHPAGQNFTVSGWFNVSSDHPQAANCDIRFFSRKKVWDTSGGWEVIHKPNTPSINVRGKEKGNNIEVKNITLRGTGWNQIAVVYNGGASVLYLNGVEIGKKTSGGSQPSENGNGLSFGDFADGATDQSPLVGAVDECRLRTGSLSAAWIAADCATVTNAAFLSAGEAQSYGGTFPPAVSVSVTDRQYTNVSFTVSVGSLGTGATQADVSAMFAATDDFANPLWTTNYTVQGVGAQSVSLAGLATGTTYYLQAQIVNDQDVTNTSPVVALATLAPGAPTGTALFDERGFTTLAATGATTAFGTGGESAAMRLEASTDGFETVAAFSPDAVAALGESAPLTISGLSPGTAYALRLRITNNWGVAATVALPDVVTRAVPFATTGIGWTFSADGSTVDITFGVSGVYDGATGSATLYYGESANPTASQGDRPVAAAGDLLWPGLPVTAETMYAKVVLSATLGDQVFSETYAAPISAGSTAVSVSDFANHQSAEDSVRVRVGDVVTLPELAGTDFYYLGNNRFGSLEGNVLTATEPGILGVFRVTDAGATTNTLPVVVLPEKIGSGDIYILKDNSIGNGWGYWDEAAKWEKVGSDTNDSWPHNPNDIAILGYWKNTGSISFEPRSGDVSLGALYIGNFRNAEAKLIFRYRNRVVFSRTDGKPALIQFCANDRLTAKGATLSFQDSIAGVEFPCGVVIDGGWDGVENRCPRAYFEFKAPSFLLPEGKTLLLQNFSPSRDGEGTSFEKPFTGGGLVWNRSAANFNWTGQSLASFTGTLRDSSHGASSFGYQAPLFIRSPGSNTVAEVVGFVSANSDANPHMSSSSVGILQTGFNQAWREAKYHPDPWFPGRGLVLHGGTYQANALESVWGYGVADKKIGDVLSLSGGLNFLNRSWNRDQNKGYAVNWVEFDSVEHDDKSTIFFWGPFWSNGSASSSDTSVTNCAKGVMETIPAGALATNVVTILHGISAFAAGPAGDPRETAAHPVVPWIAFPADSSSGGWNNLAFGAFDSDGRLVTPVRASVSTLADAAAAGANAILSDKNLAIASDVAVNSLFINNQNKGKTLGEGRTLTVSSGGLLLHGASAVGTEAGGAANGSLVLGDATHPAYVWARGKTSGPNQLWAPVTAPGGFVSAYTGNLVLGGNQTNILDELIVNAGSLTLGSATTPCRLAKNLPIRIYANATLKLPNADSTGGKLLYFDGAAGWFGKVEVADGVEAACKKAFWRDYPESPEWKTFPRGYYSGDEATANSVDKCVWDPVHFSGSGVIRIVQDECIDATLMILR